MHTLVFYLRVFFSIYNRVKQHSTSNPQPFLYFIQVSISRFIAVELFLAYIEYIKKYPFSRMVIVFLYLKVLHRNIQYTYIYLGHEGKINCPYKEKSIAYRIHEGYLDFKQIFQMSEQYHAFFLAVVILAQRFKLSTLWWTSDIGYSSTFVVHTKGINGK